MMDYEGRIARLREALSEGPADALLVTNLTNVRYLTGFSGTNGQVLVTQGSAVFFTDGRYRARASELVQGADVAVYKERLADLLPDRIAAGSVTALGVEAATMTLAERADLDERLKKVAIVPTKNVVEHLRRRKEPQEIAALEGAIALSDDAFSWIIDRIAPGVTEREIALDLEVRMRQAGAEAVSFPPIVGSGPLSAHIHHTPGERSFEKGDSVVLDLGARVDGYCSDLTRTVVVGPASDEQRALYELVLVAQAAGIDAIAAGKTGKEVDAAARRVIDDAGHADDFGHGLGHGVGLDIHEAPRLHFASTDTLATGNVVTVEPGVYVVKSSGVRIEDVVAVTGDGARILGSAPKDRLIEL